MEVIGTEAEVDRNSLKIAAIAAVGILSAFGFSYFLNQLTVLGGTPNLLLALLFALLFLAVYALQPMLIKSPGKNYTVVLMEAVALVALFYELPPIYLSGSFVALLIFMGLGIQYEMTELKERLRVRVSKVARVGLRSAISGLAIFVTLVFLGSVRAEGTLISKSAFEKLIAPAAPFLQLIYPGVSLSDTFEGAAKVLVKSQLAGTPEVALLSEAQLNAFISQSVQALEKQFVEFLGIPFGAKDVVMDILYRWFIATFSALPVSLQNTIVAGVGVLIFFALRSTSLIFAVPIEFFAFLLFKLLILTGFAARFSENRSREFVVLK